MDMACSSKIKIANYVFEWKCLNTGTWSKGDFIQSELFFAGAELETMWYMKFYPSGIGYAIEGNSSWSLVMIDGRNVKTCGAVTLKNENGSILAKDTVYHTFQAVSDEYVITNFIKRDNLTSCKLTIVCELSLNEKNILPYVRRVKDFRCIVADIYSLFSDKKNTDLTIVSQDQKEFTAHKTVLSARSETFASMLQNDFKTDQKDRIELPDVLGCHLEEMLTYIYSGSLSKWSHALCIPLYEAGHKYKVNGLKEACSQYLKENLTVEICVRTLILSDLHADEELKKQVMKYISASCIRHILNTRDWRSMVQEHPHLVDGVILAISKYSNASEM